MSDRVCEFCSKPMPPEKKGVGCEKCDEAHINRGLKNAEIFFFSVPIFFLTVGFLYSFRFGFEAVVACLPVAIVDASLIWHVVKIRRSRK